MAAKLRQQNSSPADWAGLTKQFTNSSQKGLLIYVPVSYKYIVNFTSEFTNFQTSLQVRFSVLINVLFV